ncbi:MAG: DUF1326 domain-containing protein [Candidatus Binatus sp.]
MSPVGTKWRIAGESAVTCNCAWGCPCQFNAPPSRGSCQAVAAHEIREGAYGSTSLSGLRFAQVISWPGAIENGNGTRVFVLDERASEKQREALIAITSGKQGGAYFEVFGAVCPNTLPPLFKRIDFVTDRERRTASLKIDGIAEYATEPIKNPTTGEEHRARIVLPSGFEYKEAEMGNATRISATGGGDLVFEYRDCYAQLNAFDWTNA